MFDRLACVSVIESEESRTCHCVCLTGWCVSVEHADSCNAKGAHDSVNGVVPWGMCVGLFSMTLLLTKSWRWIHMARHTEKHTVHNHVDVNKMVAERMR